MNTIHILTPSLLAVALVSCASQKADEYDTGNPYGAADPAMAQTPNPVYDSPAAYEEGAGVPMGPESGVPAIPPVPEPTMATGPATIHTVVKGDTLSGLSSKYDVPIESIKAANQMTNDIVVLGRKMVIPPR